MLPLVSPKGASCCGPFRENQQAESRSCQKANVGAGQTLPGRKSEMILGAGAGARLWGFDSGDRVVSPSRRLSNSCVEWSSPQACA